MGVAIAAERVGGTAQVQRAGGLAVRHQHALVRAEDLGGLAHETHTGHHQGGRGMAGAEARHFQRIADAAAGFARQVLQRAVHVVVGDHDRVALTQQAAQPVGGLALLVGALRRGHAGPGLANAAGAGGSRVVERDGLDGHGCLRFRNGFGKIILILSIKESARKRCPIPPVPDWHHAGPASRRRGRGEWRSMVRPEDGWFAREATLHGRPASARRASATTIIPLQRDRRLVAARPEAGT